MLVRLKGGCFTARFPCVTFHFSLLSSEETTGRLTAMGRAARVTLTNGDAALAGR